MRRLTSHKFPWSAIQKNNIIEKYTHKIEQSLSKSPADILWAFGQLSKVVETWCLKGHVYYSSEGNQAEPNPLSLYIV